MELRKKKLEYFMRKYSNVCRKRSKKKSRKNSIISKKRVRDKMKIYNKIFIKKQNANIQKFYELTYIIDGSQQKRLSDLAERFRKVNGWTEKEVLQFAVTATSQIDIENKLNFLGGIIENWEKREG